MIEGLKVTVKGTELADLCEKRAAHHQAKHEAYATQATQLAEVMEGIDTSKSSADPKREMRDRAAKHLADADELRFLAAHIELGENYLLDRNDLVRLGITRSQW